jgi:cytochrome P450
MDWFMLAMIAYPEKQKKCQEELDTVIGRSCMPTLKDWDNLPYVRATVREVLRWRPVLPFGEYIN